MKLANDIAFEQDYKFIIEGRIVRISNLEYALEYAKEFQKRNKDIIMIPEGIYQHFMLKHKIDVFKKNMLNKSQHLKDELECVESALKQTENLQSNL